MKNVIIEKSENCYAVCHPDVLGCVATGDTEVDVLKRYVNALIFHFEGILADNADKYTELTDLLVEQRELLPLEFLDKQSPHALGAVVGSPADIIYYANIYIKELQEKLNNEHK